MLMAKVFEVRSLNRAKTAAPAIATNWMMRIVMMSWLLSNPNTLEPNTAASRIMVCIPVEYQKNPLKNLRKAGSALNSFNTTNSSFQDDQNSFDSK